MPRTARRDARWGATALDEQRFCEECGRPLRGAANYCGGCGRATNGPVRAPDDPAFASGGVIAPPPPVRKPKRRALWVLLGLALIIGAGAALAATGSGSDDDSDSPSAQKTLRREYTIDIRMYDGNGLYQDAVLYVEGQIMELCTLPGNREAHVNAFLEDPSTGEHFRGIYLCGDLRWSRWPS